jgi:hypothetical protein
MLLNDDDFYLDQDNFDNQIDSNNCYSIEQIFNEVIDVSVNGKLL